MTAGGSGLGAGDEPVDRIAEWSRKAAELRARLHPGERPNAFASNPMRDLAPEMATIVNDWALGGVYADEALDLKTRTLCTTAALVALGHERYARNWMDNALNAGATPDELVALVSQLFFYIGTPHTVAGFTALATVLEERQGH